MAKQSIQFIVNPFSGTSDKSNLHSQIDKHLDLAQFDYQVIYTEGPQHATVLSQQAQDQNIDIVVAVGGDGTVNEVAKGLIGGKTSLGIIPAGSGNGFAMHLGLGRKIDKSIEMLNRSGDHWIDTCTINDEFYINVAGVGFDAKVAKATKENSKRGFRVYFEGALKEALSYKNQEYTISFKNEASITAKYFSINVANASMFGYNFVIAPLADLQDGVMDAMFIKDATKIEYMASMYRFLNRTLHKSHVTELKMVKEMTIQSNSPMYYHIDGEGYLTEEKLTFKVHPTSLKLWVPKQK